MSNQQDKASYRVETVYDVKSDGGGVSRSELDRCLKNFTDTQAIGKAVAGTLQVVVTTEPRHVMGIDYRDTVVKVSVEVEV